MLPPVPASDAGRDVFNLYLVILAMAAIVFIGVEGFILYAIFRYRRRPGDDTLPPQTHGNTLVEVIWTAIPTVIVLILFGPGRLPDIGNAIGRGIREFRKASTEVEDSIRGEPKSSDTPPKS